jgi:hypothetical protein
MSSHPNGVSGDPPAPTLFPIGQVPLNPRKRAVDTSPSIPSSPSANQALSHIQSGIVKKRRTQRSDKERPDWVIDKEDSWVLDPHKLQGVICGISRHYGEITRGRLGDIAEKELNGGLVVLCILGSTNIHLGALRYHSLP